MILSIEGTTVAWTTRVMVALLDMEPNVLFWPDADEREEIARAFDREHDVRDGCVGIIDGFHVVLAHRPRRPDGADWFNRKERYSFNVLGICDQARRIRHLTVGHVGRTGDNPM